jgi:hypothetical protein
MMLYDRWADERGWPPEVVRRLRRKELFWLPVVHTAKAEAVRQIQAIQDK